MTRDTPRDIVPPHQPTRAEILFANDMLGQPITVTQAGEMISDADGLPLAVGPSETHSGTWGVPRRFTRAELEAAGVAEEEVPNVDVID